MAAHAAERLRLRCADRHVLAIQNTTVVNSSGGGGLYLHVCAALIAAVTVQQLVHARDGGGAEDRLRPIIDAFEEADIPLVEALCATLEGKTQRQKNPHPKRSLAYAAWVCARLGGWTGCYGKPGPVVMLQGWLKLQAAKQGLSAITASQNV